MKNFAVPRGLVRESVGITVGSTVPDFFTVEEAAAILRIGRTAAYALAREYLATDGASGLPVVRLGKLLRVPRTRLEAMIGGPITWPLKVAPTVVPTIGIARPRASRTRASVAQAPMLPFGR
jgi:Helix-turn-helix domain